MANTYDGVTLYIAVGTVPDETALLFSERPIPGGVDVYVDIGAAQLEHITLDLYFPAYSDYNTIKGKVGQEKVLNTDLFGNHTKALLTRLTQTSVSPLGERRGTAEFTITG